MLRNLLAQVRTGTLSLKTVLAIYFVPISILPTIFISIYATQVFEENTQETLERRAASERDAITGEIDALEAELLSQTRANSRAPRLIAAMSRRNLAQMGEVLGGFHALPAIRLYSADGEFLAGRKGTEGENHIPYISRDGLRRVKSRGETLERYFSEDSKGFITVVRCLIRTKDRLLGVLEEEFQYGQKSLSELKNRRGVDVVFLNRDFTNVAATFALSNELLKSFSALAFQRSSKGPAAPIFVQLGDARFAAFLYDLPAPFGKSKKWGYVALFLSLTSADATAQKVKLALVYLTLLLILVASLLIFVFSNRLMRPIEMLVLAMKRIKTGRVEQIPAIDSTYEIEYLVRSFNEMSRNVSAAKRTLEMKLEELHEANQEIKTTQTTLVQSAKMISLGQLVAGVAHELNNPIAFIYSNMHHLSEYVGKMRALVKEYRSIYPRLKPEDRARMEKLERELEIDFILKDMEDLTRSCVEGANRTKEIVLGLRTFSRMDESEFRMADLREGLRSTIRLLTTEFKDRVTIHQELGEIPEVECSLSQMNQVFMNLLSNAAQAIERKGDIWIRTRLEGDRVEIEIEDNGCGIPEEAMGKIFDPFYTTKKVGEGTGLGLSIAYGLVQKHQGTILVTSAVGRGTKFTIRLPVRQAVNVAS